MIASFDPLARREGEGSRFKVRGFLNFEPRTSNPDCASRAMVYGRWRTFSESY